jgi:hypothetical protein
MSLGPVHVFAESPDVTDRRQSTPTVDEILADWSGRGSQFSTGIIEWTVTRQTRSETFGPPSGGKTVRVLFDQRGFRVESRCPPAEGVVGARTVFDRDPLGTSNSHTRFHTSLGSRFRLLANDVPQRDQPYVFIREAGRDVHLWDGESGASPYGGIFPVAAGAEYIAVPTSSLLVDALSHALHLAFGTADDSGTLHLELKPEHPLVRGRRCVVVEEHRPGHLPNGDTSLEVRRYWVDPGRDHLVLRSAVSTGEGVLQRQYDFEYDSDAAAFGVPDRIELMQLSGPLVVHDLLALARTRLELGVPLPDDAFAWEFSPKMLVTDFNNREQFVVLEDGKKRIIATRDAESGGSRVGGSRVLPVLGRLVLKSVTWPGIVLTMPLMLMVFAIIRSRGRQRDQRRRAGEMDLDATHRGDDVREACPCPSKARSFHDERRREQV